MPYPNNFHNAITYELNQDKLIFIRRVYSFFDLLRDVGGLFSALAGFCTLLVSIVQYRGVYMYLQKELFVWR